MGLLRIARTPLVTVTPQTTVMEAVCTMDQQSIGAVAVTDGNVLVGMFSERDLMIRVVIEGLQPDTTPVGRVMSTNISTVDEAATLEDAMESMKAHGCRHLPVMRDAKVVGFLSMRDLMNHELAHKTEELHHMRAYIHGTS